MNANKLYMAITFDQEGQIRLWAYIAYRLIRANDLYGYYIRS